MALRPLLNTVVVSFPDTENKTEAGIVISGVTDRTNAVVVAVGPGQHTSNGVLVEPTVKAGDRVIVRGYGQVVKHGGVEYELFPAQELLAVIE